MKKILALLMILVLSFVLLACEKSASVNSNLRNQEGNFMIYRRVTVINLRSDKVLFELTGYLNIDIDSDGDLNVTIKVSPTEYKLHYIRLTNDSVYVSEQIENAYTNPYHWEIRIFAIIPVITGD